MDWLRYLCETYGHAWLYGFSTADPPEVVLSVNRKCFCAQCGAQGVDGKEVKGESDGR